MEDITNQTLVDKISQRIADMDIDALLAASDIEEYLVDSRSTVFPQVLFTELARPVLPWPDGWSGGGAH